MLYQRNYVLYGWDHIHQGCTLEPCSDFQNFMKNKFGVQGLCSPLPGYDSRRLKKNKDDGNVAPFRSKVPSDERVTKCNAKHRTPTKRCLFVHGAGAPMPQNAFGSSLRNKFPRYWGPVHSQYATHWLYLRGLSSLLVAADTRFLCVCLSQRGGQLYQREVCAPAHGGPFLERRIPCASLLLCAFHLGGGGGDFV